MEIFAESQQFVNHVQFKLGSRKQKLVLRYPSATSGLERQPSSMRVMENIKYEPMEAVSDICTNIINLIKNYEKLITYYQA